MLQVIESMRMQAIAAPQRAWLIAGVLLGIAGLAALLAGSPAATEATAAVDPAAPALALAREKCPECGVVVSVTDIRPEQRGEDLAARAMSRVASGNYYEVTLRMRDGSSRVFLESNAGHWRRGERVVVIAGTAPAKE